MIKLLDLLKEQIQKPLNEAKQIGSLYHFTYRESISRIFNQGIRFTSDNSELPKYKDKFYISTTRDYSGRKFAKDSEYVVRITLDGSKISEHYSIEPINQNYLFSKQTGGEDDYRDNTRYRSVKDVYYEERIWSSKEEYLNPKYIIKMDTIIPESEIKDEIEWGKEDSARRVYFDDSIFKYINDGKLNFVKNFNTK
jgi:hypothetical protein